MKKNKDIVIKAKLTKKYTVREYFQYMGRKAKSK